MTVRTSLVAMQGRNGDVPRLFLVVLVVLLTATFSSTFSNLSAYGPLTATHPPSSAARSSIPAGVLMNASFPSAYVTDIFSETHAIPVWTPIRGKEPTYLLERLKKGLYMKGVGKDAGEEDEKGREMAPASKLMAEALRGKTILLIGDSNSRDQTDMMCTFFGNRTSHRSNYDPHVFGIQEWINGNPHVCELTALDFVFVNWMTFGMLLEKEDEFWATEGGYHTPYALDHKLDLLGAFFEKWGRKPDFVFIDFSSWDMAAQQKLWPTSSTAFPLSFERHYLLRARTILTRIRTLFPSVPHRWRTAHFLGKEAWYASPVRVVQLNEAIRRFAEEEDLELVEIDRVVAGLPTEGTMSILFDSYHFKFWPVRYVWTEMIFTYALKAWGVDVST